MWQEADIKKVFKRIGELQGEMVQMQTALSALPAISPISQGIGEVEKAAYVKKMLEQIGFDKIDEYHAPDKASFVELPLVRTP